MTLDDWLTAAGADPDPGAVLLIAADDLEEQGAIAEASYLRQERSMLIFPGHVGEVWLINTVTRYFIGRVAEKGPGYVVLKRAAWVHWTGRLSVLLEVLQSKKPDWRSSRFGTRRPRVETSPPGLSKVIALQSVVDSDGPFAEAALPEEPVE